MGPRSLPVQVFARDSHPSGIDLVRAVRGHSERPRVELSAGAGPVW